MKAIKFILRWIVLLFVVVILAMMSWLIAIIAVGYVVLIPCFILGEHFIAWLSNKSTMDTMAFEFADYGSTLLVPFKGMWLGILWASTGSRYG